MVGIFRGYVSHNQMVNAPDSEVSKGSCPLPTTPVAIQWWVSTSACSNVAHAPVGGMHSIEIWLESVRWREFLLLKLYFHSSSIIILLFEDVLQRIQHVRYVPSIFHIMFIRFSPFSALLIISHRGFDISSLAASSATPSAWQRNPGTWTNGTAV